MFLDEFDDYYGSGDPYNEDAVVMPQSDVMITGSPATYNVVSDTPESSIGSVFSSALSILGSIGKTARDVGTAVGTVRRDLKAAEGEYRVAQTNAYQGNALGQWWQYSTTQDKMMIGLAVAGIAVVLLVKR